MDSTIAKDDDNATAQTLGEIKSLLAAHGLRPQHKLGQNFLIEPAHLERILNAASIKPNDVVLEVGPGTGVLSVPLLEAGAKLVAVEIDRHLEPILRLKFNTHRQSEDQFVELMIDDVLEGKHSVNLNVIRSLRRAATSGDSENTSREFKLIANLPYNVASPLLANLVLLPYLNEGVVGDPIDAPIPLPDSEIPIMSHAVITIQKEVADRLTAKPGGKEYGALGVLIQAMCHVKRVAVLKPGCFWPQPKVDSAIVELKTRKTPLTTQPTRLAGTLHQLFSHRRKQIGTILGRETILPDGIDATQRPEQLTVEQLVALSKLSD